MTTTDPATAGTTRRWLMLALGSAAPMMSGFVANGAVFLIPAAQQRWDLTLAQAGLLLALPNIGVMATLIAWGALADAIGERIVLTSGMLATAAAVTWAALAGSALAFGTALLVAGLMVASANAASGRVVVGWFPPRRRGLAMGIRQASQPLGVGLAALTLPTTAERHGIPAALVLPAALAVVIGLACALGVIDPPRPDRRAAPALAANPYRAGRTLWRIHAVSVLLVVPQFVTMAFALVWLTEDRSWSAAAAGTLILFTQLIGAAARMSVGAWSDRVGSRMRPLRWVAVAAAASMALLAAADALDTPVAVVLLVIASVVSVTDNGLAFTAVAEIAGPFWSGRALGAQNTTQFLAASAVVPAAAALIGAAGYSWTFAAAALAAVLAIPLVPTSRQ